MHLESPTVTVNKNQEHLYTFLTEVENYKTIMPDSIQKFEVTGEESFVFQLKGMPEIGLKLSEKQPHNKVVLQSASDKFTFSLTATISKISEEESKAQLVFDGEFNAMMAMMVKSPLKKFIETLSSNIEKL